MTLATYIHSIDPFLFQVSETVGVRWYGLSYVAGFVTGYLILTWLARRKRIQLSQQAVGDFVLWVAIGTMIGGRLGYCVFYRPDLLVHFGDSFPFWGALEAHKGGMASHGGIIGICVAVWLFGRKHGFNILHLLDLTALTATIGVFYGRIANFINGELVGRICSPDMPFAVKFPQDMYDWGRERLAYLGDAVKSVGVTSTEWLNAIDTYNTDPAARGLVHRTISDMIREIQYGHDVLALKVAEFLDPRHPSQIYAALLEGALIFVILGFIWRIPRRPGTIAGVFLILYPTVRFLGEFYRLPDAFLGDQPLGLSRGQWLSIGMFVIGFGLLFYWRSKSSVTMGGWMVRSNLQVESDGSITQPRQTAGAAGDKPETPSTSDQQGKGPFKDLSGPDNKRSGEVNK